MPVLLEAPASLAPVPGVRAGTASLGQRAEPRDDLTVFELSPGTRAAGVFTRNRLRAAPVTVAMDHLRAAAPRLVLVNAGNANAGTGEAGIEAARATCAAAAALGGVDASAVLPFSTGVINEPLDVAAFERALPAAFAALEPEGWIDASQAILTTDIVAKGRSAQFACGDRRYTITGVAKGSGMICPNMATMLAFIATDAPVTQDALDAALAQAVDDSFNAITVDGDTSTNDACLLVSTGRGAGPEIAADSATYPALFEAVHGMCRFLAHAIVRDGEGATKFVAIEVREANSRAEAKAVGYTVAHSPLVKTALFAADPNVGRICAAVGRAPVDEAAGPLDMGKVRVSIGDVLIAESGTRAASYVEADAAAVMSEPEICIAVSLGRGDAAATVWTCDLSYDYVKINAEYRS